uniref:ATP synthase complex subunit 8 n=1 Tax=Phloeotribus sp. BMNH 1047247 TaxID=1903799 RepID=A0A343A5H3_9CUCU|nr:ATP synthase F0 subunit 8 [Phloeotribus sp. BMNH 1047247]
MPQMAPMNWILLIFYFIILMLMFILMNFYSFNYTPKKMKIKTSFKNLIWKW